MKILAGVVPLILLVAGFFGWQEWQVGRGRAAYAAWQSRFSQLQAKAEAYDAAVRFAERAHRDYVDAATMKRMEANTKAKNTEAEAYKALDESGGAMKSLELRQKAERMRYDAETAYELAIASEKPVLIRASKLTPLEQAEYEEISRRIAAYKIDH